MRGDLVEKVLGAGTLLGVVGTLGMILYPLAAVLAERFLGL